MSTPAVLAAVVVIVVIVIGGVYALVIMPGSSPAASSTSAPATTTSSASQSSVVSLAELYTQAKAEGSLQIMGGSPQASMESVIGNFSSLYPGITVSYTFKPGPQIASLLLAQAQSNHVSYDAVIVTYAQYSPLPDNAVVNNSIDWTHYGVSSEYLINGSTIKLYDSPVGVGYNTQLVNSSEVPKTWQDLASPQWNGKIAIPQNGLGLTVFGLTNATQGLALAAQIKSLNPLLEANALAAETAVTNGQAAVGLVNVQDSLAAQAKGAPIALAPVSPIASVPVVADTLTGAAHPYAAMLFLAWLSSAQGRQQLSAGNLAAASPCDASPVATTLCNMGIQDRPVSTPAQLNAYTTFEKDFANLYGTSG